MKMLTAAALLCALMALTRAAAFKEAEAAKDLIVRSHLVKRATSCPGGWSEFNGRCFHYFPAPMTWAKAQEYHDIQRLIMISSYAYKEAWLGGSDAQEEGLWLWSDNSLFTYQNWCPGEPNNHAHGQHCLQMNFGGTSDYSISIKRFNEDTTGKKTVVFFMHWSILRFS
ncbi:hypothetical protein FQN60_006390 [Etheostoma spectabile]|uniref:C-type lectin domain-containing protein n=1 Tax=Etheostoma spectabile TaxID=54343 RepID=A0A5J5CPC4_9PERO|nr:hypothetical protein FQN60_006390 [Etheostoma spectabile]